MNATDSSRRRLPKVLVVAACAVALALVGGVLYWATTLLIGAEGQCDEPKGVARLAQVSAVAVPPAPSGAAPVPGASGAECLDDSGTEVWLVADTYYAYDGDPDKVVDHYWAAAPAAGWKATGSRPQITPGFLLKDMCFRKEVDGKPTLLRVSYSAQKEYSVSVNAVLDGSRPDC
ncbi:hypothetical protein ABZX75_33695 [Streptomyces sp. NPDC003038]|uniref:hypothetical protein n=1 Tax=unclassified Streptomyces TaxID=2593676 RepID=UPI0033B6497B